MGRPIIDGDAQAEHGPGGQVGGRTGALIDLAVFLGVVGALFAVEAALALPQTWRGFAPITGSVVACWLLLRRRGRGWRDVGLRRPARLWALPVWCVVVFAVTMGLALAAQPLLFALFDAEPDLSRFAGLYRNLPMLLAVLASVWITAALFEELVYRGFVLDRLSGLLGGGGGATALAIVVQAVLFGALHFYQGPPGMVITGLVGLIFGAAFVAMGRNLVALIVVHGVIDTLSAIQFYLVDVTTLASG